jgi:hypothetical protein
MPTLVSRNGCGFQHIARRYRLDRAAVAPGAPSDVPNLQARRA